jgi:hypothetical protein
MSWQIFQKLFFKNSQPIAPWVASFLKALLSHWEDVKLLFCSDHLSPPRFESHVTVFWFFSHLFCAPCKSSMRTAPSYTCIYLHCAPHLHTCRELIKGAYTQVGSWHKTENKFCLVLVVASAGLVCWNQAEIPLLRLCWIVGWLKVIKQA